MLNISIDSLSKVLENYTSAEKDSVVEYCTTVHTTKQNNKTIPQKPPSRVMDLHTTIDYGIGVLFKNYVQNRYGKLKGCIGIVLEDAIREYLESKSKQQQSTNCTIFHGKRIRNDVNRNLLEIKTEFQRRTQFPHFSSGTLKEIIRKIIGNRDARTERKYIILISRSSKEIQNSTGIVWNVSGFCNSVSEC